MIVAGIQVLNTIASLALISIGLAVIFGMMRVMNFAHGEFLMLGAYAVQVSHSRGVNLWIAIFFVAPLFVGLVGVAIERLIIRRLYGRMMDTLLATWGLSLFISGLMAMLFGNFSRGISTPLGSFEIGGIRESFYKFVIIVATAAIFLAAYLVLRYTRYGLIARATMDNPSQASALGISPGRVYTTSFAVGAALSGLAGAILAPVSGVLPTMGAAYIGKAFITVICGGEAILAGTASAAALFGTVNQLTSIVLTPELGEVSLLIVALLMLRLLPSGMTGYFFRKAL